MKFIKHSDVEGQHAFLSASNYHWINYDDEKLLARLATRQAAVLGTRLHDYAHNAISLGRMQPNTLDTVNMYINDCIGYRMQTEVVLFFTYDAFGTADAISFRREGDVMVLRIFDLKTGVTPASDVQLKAYAALFCLEYKVRPMEIEYDLRIYQTEDVIMIDTDPEEIAFIMDRYKTSAKLIERKREEGVI